jgi:hypothetical protein
MAAMKKETKLRKIVKRLFDECKHDAHLSWVESHATSPGAFDVNYCIDGVEGWLELKAFPNIEIRTTQVSWARERIEAGGRPLVLIQNGNDYALLAAKHLEELKKNPTWGNVINKTFALYFNDIGSTSFFSILKEPEIVYECQ